MSVFTPLERPELEAFLEPYGLGRLKDFQGIAAGIGFLCAGTILKGDRCSQIKGLTTSASLWFATAIGITVGLGHVGTAVLGVLFALIILHALPFLERPDKETPR